MPIKTVDVTPTLEWDDGFALIFSFNAQAFFIYVTYEAPYKIEGTDIAGKVSETLRTSFKGEGIIEAVKYAARHSSTVRIIFDDGPPISYSDSLGKVWGTQRWYSIVG